MSSLITFHQSWKAWSVFSTSLEGFEIFADWLELHACRIWRSRTSRHFPFAHMEASWRWRLALQAQTFSFLRDAELVECGQKQNFHLEKNADGIVRQSWHWHQNALCWMENPTGLLINIEEVSFDYNGTWQWWLLHHVGIACINMFNVCFNNQCHLLFSVHEPYSWISQKSWLSARSHQKFHWS